MSGARNRLKARTTASPIRRMSTSIGMAGRESSRPKLLAVRRREPTALVEHELLDDLGRSEEEGLRDRQAQRLRGLRVDHQLELCRLFDREAVRLGALEDLVHEDGGPSVQLPEARPIRHETARVYMLPRS